MSKNIKFKIQQQHGLLNIMFNFYMILILNPPFEVMVEFLKSAGYTLKMPEFYTEFIKSIFLNVEINYFLFFYFFSIFWDFLFFIYNWK